MTLVQVINTTNLNDATQIFLVSVSFPERLKSVSTQEWSQILEMISKLLWYPNFCYLTAFKDRVITYEDSHEVQVDLKVGHSHPVTLIMLARRVERSTGTQNATACAEIKCCVYHGH